jgi:hypothetical protein
MVFLLELVVGGFGQSLGGAGSVPTYAFGNLVVVSDDINLPAFSTMLHRGRQQLA